MKAIKSLLGPTSSEVKPRRQEEILKVLEDLKRWFSSLAESHDQLRSNPKEEVTLGRCDDPRMMESSGSMIEDPEISDPILEKKFMQNGLDEKPANKVPQDMIISSTLREFRIIGRSQRCDLRLWIVIPLNWNYPKYWKHSIVSFDCDSYISSELNHQKVELSHLVGGAQPHKAKLGQARKPRHSLGSTWLSSSRPGC
ncbi:hypothetical protein CRG98_023529 [Punica granatum]|uniref:Uncharacterized protein n=1 Tax=Punica granatum TaxID=22663 RepID=A0A2I0JJG4_PUNGR|nr:hypothetical protein CRG98_023529 [Punica granatum]